jgi:hypothetical protein
MIILPGKASVLRRIAFRCQIGKALAFRDNYGRVEKRLSREAHNLEIVGSTPTPAPKYGGHNAYPIL